MRLSQFTSFVLLGSAAILAAFGALVHVTAVLRATSGLNATYSYLSNGRDAIHEQIDCAVTSSTILTSIHKALAPSMDRWEGYLVVPTSDSYRFIVNTDGVAHLSVDNSVMADERMGTGGRSATLTRGLHAIRLDYRSSGGLSRVLLLQSRGDAGAFAPVPSLYVVPRLITLTELRARRTVVITGRVLPVVALSWTLFAAVLAVRQARRPATRDSHPAGGAYVILSGAAVLFAAGLGWGMPAYDSWAPDELLPGDVEAALDARFSAGWATKYPPVHFALLALAHCPYYIARHFGLVELGDLQVTSWLLVISRAISVAMALGIIWSIYAMTEEMFDRRSANFAALVVLSAMPLTYYSKTANLDVPYLFWLCLALRHYARTGSRASPSDFYRFAAFGAIAICTKDQAYGFFVFPAVLLASLAFWHRRAAGLPSIPVLIRMCSLTMLALVILMNVPFNLAGVVHHVQLITGPDSVNFRMYDRTTSGIAQMFADSIYQIANIMSWPLFVAALVGTAMAVWRRHTAVILLLIASVSYVVTFLWVVLYQYDRFWLGNIITLAPATGWWIARVTRIECSHRTTRLIVTVVVFAYAIARCAALDILMLRDSRYAAELRLRREIKSGDRVAAVGIRPYLPRPEIAPWIPMRPTTEQLHQLAPDVLVVNVGYALRTGGGYSDALVRRILPGDSMYVLAGEYRTKVPFPLSLERRFQRVEEDPFSNLTKINPMILIYKYRNTRR